MAAGSLSLSLSIVGAPDSCTSGSAPLPAATPVAAYGDVAVDDADAGLAARQHRNAPILVQDRLFTGAQSRAEMPANVELRVTAFRVLRDQEVDVEISMASVAVRPVKKWIYRIAAKWPTVS
ncbi:MAG: hypothetical protein JJE04_27285 [Acidobacteriia bacterium]|nr:hypothetical protein [Terriglobia bacterium]